MTGEAERKPGAASKYQWHPGLCFLYCRRTDVIVRWFGSVRTQSQQDGEIYACETCLAELDYMISMQIQARDISDLQAR